MLKHEGLDSGKSHYDIKYKGRQLKKSGMFEYVFHFSKKFMEKEGWEAGQKLTYAYDDENKLFGFKEFDEDVDVMGWKLQRINLESSNCRLTRKCRESRGYPLVTTKYGVGLEVLPEKVNEIDHDWVCGCIPMDKVDPDDFDTEVKESEDDRA